MSNASNVRCVSSCELGKSEMVKSTSQFSFRFVDASLQIVQVETELTSMARTIIELLQQQDSSAPLLRRARERDTEVYTSYGDLLSFLSPSGEGDLRRIGVERGQTVAYLAPPGGSAESAVCFLTIAAQACAVPLSSTATQSETLSALEQLGVQHVLLFEGVNAREAIAACRKFCSKTNCSLHLIKPLSSHKPGLFQFESLNGFEKKPNLLSQPEDNIILLRTSGTTSLPKIIPIAQQDLVVNGTILANSIGINRFDVTYSVMPLDHIGGISGSIMASLSVGATITCDELFNPRSMVEALSQSQPKPTWYSAVPTIHLATLHYLTNNRTEYLNNEGVWEEHNLRLIRSGAAALKEEDRLALMKAYGCAVFATYSMSELMPITQPDISQSVKANSVGVPLTASLAIVDPVTLKPQPFGVKGEIAICGDTMFKGYLNNPEANNDSRFLMHLPHSEEICSWFRTGDLGQIDQLGNLTLEGRLKELIKRGGEQIAPAEVENYLTNHPSIDNAVCFPVPSETYGEEVGCALVSEDSKFSLGNQTVWKNELREFLMEKGLSSTKVPSVWTVIEQSELPMTSSQKYRRNAMATLLGISASPLGQQRANTCESGVKKQESEDDVALAAPSSDKPSVDWDTVAGFRFILVCYVMFMHMGSNDSWGAFNNLRQFPWHVHAFFTLAGFSLAVWMPKVIQGKFRFVRSRVAAMYPLYALAIIFSLGNLLVTCRPSTFISSFSWINLLQDSDIAFCSGTPWIEGSWLGNALLSLGIYATGIQATPLWQASWFIGFYLWFISMYFQCLVVFPAVYNALYKNRGQVNKLLTYIGVGLIANIVIIMSFWWGYAVNFTGYGLFDPVTGLQTNHSTEQINLAGQENAMALNFYLFAPFWMVYFLIGVCAAFVYDAIRPREGQQTHFWGIVADSITVIMIAISIAHVIQGYSPYDPHAGQFSPNAYFMRPEAANSYADASVTNRIWDNVYARLFAPLTLLWLFALSTGRGVTARLLRARTLSRILAPTTYACFLFHQMVGQWYYSITRSGEWWSWWNDQKSFYWFSPQPVPIEWYEYFYVVGLVVIFAKFIQLADPIIRHLVSVVVISTPLKKDSRKPLMDIADVVLMTASKVSGLEVKRELSLNDNGLTSLSIVQFVSTLESELLSIGRKVELSITEIMSAQDLERVIVYVEHSIQHAKPTLTQKSRN